MGRKRITDFSLKGIALLLAAVMIISGAAAVPVHAEDSAGGQQTIVETKKETSASLSNAKKVTIPSSKKYGKQYTKRKKYKGPSKWEKTISTLEKRSRNNQGKVIFIGSSSIRKWTSLSGDMAPLKVVNLGFGGSTVNDCVYYADRLIVPGKPKAIVFYAGTNDIAYGYSPKVVYNRTVDFLTYIHKALPGTKIYYVEQTRQPKRNKYWKKMKQLNAKMKKYASSDPLVTYIATSKLLNTKKDKAQKKYFLKDRLHFNKKGYKVWTSAIKPVLIKDLSK